MRLKDKVAIITGAAAGMGAATARLFAREGAKLILTDIDDKDGPAVAADIVRTNGNARFEKHDVSSEADWQQVVDTALAACGRIDILINNAGVSGSIPDKLDLAMWDRQMSINARGSFLGLRAVIPIMQKQKAGAIVNISSISGILGQDYVHMGYNAAKGAVRTMTKAAAVQYAPDGIRINSVHPGFMPPMRTSKLTADPELRRRLLGSIPMGRTGEVDEVAYANLFLASDEASYITGVELIVDGGFTAA
jgi:NAD(P)-dependent dehydrogenase (short-subunit alcohol dehydrogenase family)